MQNKEEILENLIADCRDFANYYDGRNTALLGNGKAYGHWARTKLLLQKLDEKLEEGDMKYHFKWMVKIPAGMFVGIHRFKTKKLASEFIERWKRTKGESPNYADLPQPVKQLK